MNTKKCEYDLIDEDINCNKSAIDFVSVVNNDYSEYFIYFCKEHFNKFLKKKSNEK